MSDPRIPYCKQSLGEPEIQAVVDVLRSGWIARGQCSVEFEIACATRLAASHAIACTNGSAALEIAMRGLGIGPGDHVIVPTLTWVTSAMAVRLVGATPVFCDVDPVTLNATPATVAARWTDRTRAVIAVDMAGIPHDVAGMRALTHERNAWLVEDAAHAFGARRAASPVGSDGGADVTTFSFHPAKTITTAEGGLVTCEDEALAERMRLIRSAGITREFDGARGSYDFLATIVGSNYHMSELHAALGLVQLGRLDDLLAKRRDAYAALMRGLAPLESELELPQHPDGSSWNLFTVRLRTQRQTLGCDSARRDAVIRHLFDAGVSAHVHYPLLHRQPVFGSGLQSYTDDHFPVAEHHAMNAITLPLFPDITESEIDRVVQSVGRALTAIPEQSVASDERASFTTGS